MSIWQGSNMIAGSGGGGIANYDGKSITENSMEEIQTVGVINSRDSSTAIKTWTGTKAQYNAIVTKDPNTLYNITDDVDEIVITRTLGQTVQSTIPLVDAGLHLLDGSVIAYGSYKAFVDYMAGLVTDYPDLFTSEANWQTSVTNYGACEKFVYDSVNKTVKLPKRTTEHGALIKSYSSGTDWYRIYSDGWCEQGGYVTVSASTGLYTYDLLKEYRDINYLIIGQFGSDYSSDFSSNRAMFPYTTSQFRVRNWSGTGTKQSWSACGYIDISDLQQSAIYEYICIATYPKTQIEVDIDEIATDLNGKADIDLSNMNPTQTVKNTIVSWGIPDYTSEVSVSEGNLPPIAPYDMMIYYYCSGPSTNVNFYVEINGIKIWQGCYGGNVSLCVYASKGDTLASGRNGGGFIKLAYYRLKGVN